MKRSARAFPSSPSKNSKLSTGVISLGMIITTALGAGRATAMDVPFSSAQVIGAQLSEPYSVTAGDMDCDGDLDVVGASQYGEIICWDNTNGDGSAWTDHTVEVGGPDNYTDVQVADLDDDGDLDVLAALYHTHEIRWWENTNRDAATWVEHVIDTSLPSPRAIHAADMDHDGDLDVLVSGTAFISWWENTNGDGSAWSKQDVTTSVTTVFGVNTADVDGDGDLDILSGDHDGSAFTWWENTSGDGTTWSAHTIDDTVPGAWDVHGVDMDSDGDLDVLGTTWTGETIIWWENINRDGSSWTAHSVDWSFDMADGAFVTDLDSDGDLDVICTDSGHSEPDVFAWVENVDGSATAWVQHLLDDGFDGSISVYAGDVDGDGDLDIVGAANHGPIIWWENEMVHLPISFLTEHTIHSDSTQLRCVSAPDIDGDGDLDTLAAIYGSDEVGWWRNEDGEGTAWTEVIISSGLSQPQSACAADIDRDGDLDVVGAFQGADTISWWENDTGEGTAWTEHTVATGFDGFSVSTADVDHDGDLDILGAAYADGKVIWWDNADGNGTSWTEHTIASWRWRTCGTSF